jgi:hypothetical protein
MDMMVEAYKKALEIRFKLGNNLYSSCNLLIAFILPSDQWCVKKWEGNEK